MAPRFGGVPEEPPQELLRRERHALRDAVGQDEPVVLEVASEQGQELAPEERPDDPDGQQEAPACGSPAPIRCPSTAGDEAVDVGMEREGSARRAVGLPLRRIKGDTFSDRKGGDVR